MIGRHYRHSLFGVTAVLAAAPAGAQDHATANYEEIPYEAVTSFPAPGRQARIGLRQRF